ncbi:MAG: hypothetical protein R6U31_05080 [bacterium]
MKDKKKDRKNVSAKKTDVRNKPVKTSDKSSDKPSGKNPESDRKESR